MRERERATAAQVLDLIQSWIALMEDGLGYDPQPTQTKLLVFITISPFLCAVCSCFACQQEENDARIFELEDYLGKQSLQAYYKTYLF